MKHFITRLLIILIVAVAGTSAATAQLRWGAFVAPESATLKFKQDLVSVSEVVGCQMGVQGELIFPGLGFGMDIGLMYNQLGAKVNFGERKIWASQGYGDERIWLHMLQIPLHFRFKWTRLGGLEEKIAPFVYAGPEFGITLGHGKHAPVSYAGGDLNLTVGGGFELWRNWQLSVGYTWGMTYILRTTLLDNFSARNRYKQVRLTYYF